MNTIKQHICIEVTRGEQKFLFYMPCDATWGNALDAGFEILEELQKYAKKAVEAARPAKIQTEDITLAVQGGE